VIVNNPYIYCVHVTGEIRIMIMQEDYYP